jgi:hypothetical protein
VTILGVSAAIGKEKNIYVERNKEGEGSVQGITSTFTI